MTPSAEDRRRAVAFARKIVADDAVEPTFTDDPISDDMVNLAATLLLCQRVFTERLAPVYHAAQQVVGDDGEVSMDALPGLVKAMQQARESERKAGDRSNP